MKPKNEPPELAQATHDQGEPQLPEWLQMELDEATALKRAEWLKLACYLVAFWAIVGGLIWWGFFA